MISNKSFREFAMSFADAEEKPHFHKTSFRVKKRIFATLDEKERLAVVKFNLVDQSVFIDISKGAIYPVPGGWGKSGFTYINLKKAGTEMMRDAVTISYHLVLEKKKKVKSTFKKRD